MEIWGVSAEFLHLKLNHESSFTLNNVNLECKGDKWFGNFEVEANTIYDARQIATKQLEEVEKALSIYYNSYVNSQIIECMQVTGQGNRIGEVDLYCALIVAKAIPDFNRKEVTDLLELVRKTNKTGRIATTYYQDSLKSISNNEAFLNYFKVIEIISAQYFKCAQAEKKEQMSAEVKILFEQLQEAIKEEKADQILKICNLIYKSGYVEVKRKLVLMFEDLHIEIEESVLESLIELRNHIAHGTGKNAEVDNKVLCDCKEFAREVLIKYLGKQ